MPYFSVETSKIIDQVGEEALSHKASAFIAELLGKPEGYVMVAIKHSTPMRFGGGLGPTAMVQLHSIGLPEERCAEFSGKICAFIEETLGVAPDRIYIDFRDLKRSMFGWNGKTF
jgi:phenylpyruvate tautomerase PptA (4-oxalocrotonate tautomerase family)